MIVIHYRVRGDGEAVFPRTRVTTVPDYEQAKDLIQTLTAGIQPDDETPVAAGRPARRRWTVAQLIKDRDAALDKELAEAAAEQAAMLPHIVSSR